MEPIKEFIQTISTTFKISQEELDKIWCQIDKKEDKKPISKEYLDTLKLSQLVEECKTRGLTKSGTKKILINRLLNSSSTTSDLYLKNIQELKELCKKYNLHVTGSKQTLISRLETNIFCTKEQRDNVLNDQVINKQKEEKEEDNKIVENNSTSVENFIEQMINLSN